MRRAFLFFRALKRQGIRGLRRYNAAMREAAWMALEMAADGLCLSMMMRLMGRCIRLPRVLAAAGLGGAAAWLVRRFAANSPWFWLPTALLMARLSLGPGQRVFCGAGLLFAAQGLLGGTILALWGATGSLAGAWALAIAAFSGMALWAARMVRPPRGAWQAQVTVVVRGCGATFDALVDSGNCLVDYLTHLPVIVLPEETARARLHLEETPLRPILAQTAGGRQMMGCLAAEKTVIDMRGRPIAVHAVIALSPGLEAHAPALVPLSLISQQTGSGHR